MIKQKSWLWNLTIFANTKTTTTLYPNIYVSKNFNKYSKTIQNKIIKHEEVHLGQQKQGRLKFYFLYIFCLPFFYNPWRYNWEYESYTKSGTSKTKTKELLSSWHYGWL
jgi:hypothetical protein